MSFEAFETVIVSPALKAVARHWNEARGSRGMPGWSDIKPSAIAAQLPIVWAYKYDPATGSFTQRLAGNRITSIFGRSGRGVPIADMYPPKDFPIAHARFRKVVGTPAFMRGIGVMFRHLDRYGSGERIMMPLAEDGLHADGIIGATEYRLNDAQPILDDLATGEIEEWFLQD